MRVRSESALDLPMTARETTHNYDMPARSVNRGAEKKDEKAP
jgi:hypothetical protein